MSLAAVKHIYALHEDMNGCKNLKIHLKVFFENVNIIYCNNFEIDQTKQVSLPRFYKVGETGMHFSKSGKT